MTEEAFGVPRLSDAMLRALPRLLEAGQMSEFGANFQHPSGDYSLRVRTEPIEGLERRKLVEFSGQFPRRTATLTTRGRWVANSINKLNDAK